MNEYLFTWEMTRSLAKKLVAKQFLKYNFIRYSFRWLLFGESLFWMIAFFNLNIYSLLLSVFIAACILILVYVYYGWIMIPAPHYRTKYQAGFDANGFWVDGKNYKRWYRYDQVDRFIVKKSYLIFLTKNEGMILPAEVFKDAKQRQELVEMVKGGMEFVRCEN